MKKRMSVVAILAACAILASCGQKTDSSSASDSQSGSAASSETEANSKMNATGMPIVKEPVTLKVWGMETAGNDYKTNVNTTEYEKMSGVHIEWDLFSSTMDGNQAFNLLLASGEYPDIIAGGFSPDRVNMCIEGDVLIPLNDLIEKYGESYKTALKEQPEYKDLLTASDGNIYNFMYTDTGVHKDSEYKMFVYTEWLDKLGLKAPTTPEEFKEMLIAFKEKDPNGNGVADELAIMGYFNGRQTDPICYLMNPYQLYNTNYFTISDDNKIEFEATTDGWREGLRYINDLYESGLIPEETYVQDESQFKALLNKPAGETIIGSFPSWFQGQLIDNKVLNWTDYQAIAPLKGPTGLQQSAARKGGDFQLNSGITTQCENPEIAFRWLDWMLSEDGLYFGMYGVEGISYNWSDTPAYSGAKKSIQSIKLEKEPRWNSGFFPRYDKAEVRYASSFDETQKNTNNAYVLYSAAEIYEPYYVYHNIPHLVWTTDQALSTSISDYKVAINEYIAATDTAFAMGTMDIDSDADWKTYLDTLDSMGLQDYLSCLTKYYSLE